MDLILLIHPALAASAVALVATAYLLKTRRKLYFRLHYAAGILGFSLAMVAFPLGFYFVLTNGGVSQFPDAIVFHTVNFFAAVGLQWSQRMGIRGPPKFNPPFAKGRGEFRELHRHPVDPHSVDKRQYRRESDRGWLKRYAPSAPNQSLAAEVMNYSLDPLAETLRFFFVRYLIRRMIRLPVSNFEDQLVNFRDIILNRKRHRSSDSGVERIWCVGQPLP